MKFSIRDVLLIMALLGLAAAWAGDHFRLIAEKGRISQRLREEIERTVGGYELVPKAGSPEAIDVFWKEVKKKYRPPNLEVAANLCFVLGAPAAKYQSLLDRADKSGLPADPRFVGGTQYEFWCEGKKPEEADCLAYVVVSGSPPMVVDVEVTILLK
jgi:hypothetical protein